MAKKRCEDCRYFACYGWHHYGCELSDNSAAPHDEPCENFDER